MSLNPDLKHAFAPSLQSFTLTQQNIVNSLRRVTPKAFLRNCGEGFDTDIRLLGMYSLALTDFNNMLPATSYQSASVPDRVNDLILYGTEKYIIQFMMMKYALVDISYSDGGLSVSLDRVSKLSAVHTVFDADWIRLMTNAKKGIMLAGGGLALATPRYQSQMGRLLGGMMSGGAFGWGLV